MKRNLPNPFKKIDILLVVVIILLAFVLRLYKINTPLADLHSWRQVDTAAVARNFVRNGFDLLHPKYDDLSSNQTGFENPQGYRMVEFPIYNAIFGSLYKSVPIFSLEIYGRLVSALFSLIIIFAIYYLVLKETNRTAAIIASLSYAVLPFFVFFSRVILPETTVLAFTFLSILFLYISNKETGKIKSFIFILMSAISFALALLTKPMAIFYGITLLYLIFQKYKFSFVKKIPVYLYGLIALIPVIWWRIYIQKYPEGIAFNDWLITGVNTYEGLKNIFFKPAFFRWIFFERINNYILGGYLAFFFLLGLIKKPQRYFLHTTVLSALVYLFTFQGGNVQHEYYQTLILPAFAIFIGIGVAELITNAKSYLHPIFTYTMIVFIFGLSVFFSFYKVRDYYNYPAELSQIAKVVNTLTKENDKIVTDRMGDTTLLYLIDRKGAPSIYKDPAELKNMGYNYLVTLDENEIRTLKEQKYQTIFENDKFTLFKL